jgi:hypothetical protein
VKANKAKRRKSKEELASERHSGGERSHGSSDEKEKTEKDGVEVVGKDEAGVEDGYDGVGEGRTGDQVEADRPAKQVGHGQVDNAKNEHQGIIHFNSNSSKV